MEFGLIGEIVAPSKHFRVLAANVLWVAFSLPVVLLFTHRLIYADLNASTRRLMLGVVCVGFVTAMRGGYWAPWRYFLHKGNEVAADWFIDHAIWMDGATIILCVGYTLHIVPFLKRAVGNFWWSIVLAYGLAVYVASIVTLY